MKAVWFGIWKRARETTFSGPVILLDRKKVPVLQIVVVWALSSLHLRMLSNMAISHPSLFPSLHASR